MKKASILIAAAVAVSGMGLLMLPGCGKANVEKPELLQIVV